MCFAMACAPPVDTLWAFQAHAATRGRWRRKRRGAANGRGHDSSEEDSLADGNDDAAEWHDQLLHAGSQSAERDAKVEDASVLEEQAEDRRWLRSTNVVARAGSTQQTAELRTQQRISHEARRAARALHLPWRGDSCEDARLMRVLKGLPPIGSTADADQLSDWEEALENAVRVAWDPRVLTARKYSAFDSARKISCRLGAAARFSRKSSATTRTTSSAMPNW